MAEPGKTAEGNLRIFVSWSGERSKAIAILLKDWLPIVIQSLDVWMSEEDIERGAVWFNEISEVLADAKYGILCLTRENVDKPWVLFEAGALYRGLEGNRVCPLLVDLKKADLRPPLSLVNASLMQREDIWKLVQTLNSGVSHPLDVNRLKTTFEAFYPKFEEGVKKVMDGTQAPAAKPRRTAEDMIEEVLSIVRALDQRGVLSEVFPSLGEQLTQYSPNDLVVMAELFSKAKPISGRDIVYRRRMPSISSSVLPGQPPVVETSPQGTE